MRALLTQDAVAVLSQLPLLVIRRFAPMNPIWFPRERNTASKGNPPAASTAGGFKALHPKEQTLS